MICQHDGCGNVAEVGKTECFRHRVASVGFSWRGGAVVGRDGWNMTKGDFLREHVGVDTEKEIVKTRPDLGKAD